MIDKQVLQDMEEYYPITDCSLEGGYITVKGNMLDFSEKTNGGEAHTRTLDHRDIVRLFPDCKTLPRMVVVHALREGNIRLIPEYPGFEVAKIPNDKQYVALCRYIRFFKGEVTVDIGNGDTVYKTIFYQRGTSPYKVFNDIEAIIRKKLEVV